MGYLWAMRHAVPALASLLLACTAHAQLPQANLPAPLRAAPAESLPAHLRSSVVSLESDAKVWQAMSFQSNVRLEGLQVTPSRTATLLLHRVDPFSADARIVASRISADGSLEERELQRPAGQWWCGVVEGAARSKVMLSTSAAGVLGFVQDEHGTVVIASDRPGGGGPIVSYALGELPEGVIRWDPWECTELQVPGDEGIAQGGAAMVQPCRQLRIAVETDNEFFARFAGSPSPSAAASAYVATLFAGIREIYQTDLQILPAVNFLRLWPTADDPWTQASSGNQLTEFRNWWQTNMTAQARDLAAFISTRGLGGGVAWLSVACNQTWGYSVSGNLAGSFPYPLVDNSGSNWDIIVTAHEIGHNVGTTHTHNFCPTPGDSCAPSGYFGQCQTEQVCTAAGTIMSYCHLCSGGTANIMLDFHPLCIDAVASYMTASCNTTSQTTSAMAVNDTVSTLQGSGALQLDPLANDIPVNCEAVSLESFDAFSARGVAIARLVGAGPGGRDLLRYTAPGAQTGTDTFSYRVREASGLVSLPATVTVDIAPLRRPENPVGDSAGLAVSYYALSAPAVLPDFSTLSPYLTGTSANVNFASTGGNFAGSGVADNVGAVWSGWLRVDAPGLYTLYVNSDDGSRLRIGNQAIVTNDGLHGMVEVSGTIALAAGKHAVTIEFFEAGGGAGCIASIEGPGLAKQVIPSSRFTRGGTVNRFDLTLDGRVNGADLGVLLGAWGTADALSDLDGNGSVNGADLGALLGAWTG